MPALINTTNYDAFAEFGVDGEGASCIVLVVAGSFTMPRPGRVATGPLRRCEYQVPGARQDSYFGRPGASSLRREGQSSYTRPGTDVYLLGRAWAPGGRPCKEGRVTLSVGSRVRTARIVGPRLWTQGIGTLSPEAPAPYESVELRYEHCAGGPLVPGNPVGCGIHGSAREAVGQPLPQIEDGAHPMRDWSERPPPLGFGPIARHWHPRCTYAGTYDRAWLEERAPLWPRDLDLRFFHAAAPGLCFDPYLQGGESVCIAGCHPDGDYQFELPRVRLWARTYYRRATMDIRTMRLDAVELDADAGIVQVVWRAVAPLAGGVFEHETSVVAEDVA
ncbi:DUF2169 family type VI secretion system accessory protein [Nannocystis punicea]|uniref:DUF2169 domain-containing protein n=1 Tax=Nannocystis punicea TaxID=2995304 RepID=A0ABY7HDL3_9BACT|nr:DUF2169 domain-containing protein [Nannocystis poenicansa]WAS97362.1 DUF2169 domain-containing protein [Nannocystis poenicansa]